MSFKNSKLLIEVKADTGTIRLYDNGVLSHIPFASIKSTSMDILKKDFVHFINLTNGEKKLFFYDATHLNDFTSEQKNFMRENLPKFAKNRLFC